MPSFNPHTHTGCDLKDWQGSYPESVSIHTPIQGVTFTRPFTTLGKYVSIHTPIQGVTSRSILITYTITGFNPHTHTGCDSNESINESTKMVSIHTPIQGVTTNQAANGFACKVSIHTPIQGVT